MVLCAANNGSNGFQTATNTTSPQNPGGIFSIENYCGPAPDPAGNSAFIRIVENQPSGSAGYGAYGAASWTAPPWVAILAGGGYTRMPNAFNDGWRGRFWAEGFDGSTNNILMQGTGAPNSGIEWSPTSTFASHLWPFNGYGFYHRFVFEMTCFRGAGCDRSNFNAVDANTMVLNLADTYTPVVGFTNTDWPFLAGRWVRGGQPITFIWTELGSGIRFERVRIDGAERWSIDHVATGECNRDANGVRGEFARDFQPCATASNIERGFSFDTAALADGAHTVTACAQDYAQWQGLDNTGGESCVDRTVHTDNTPPGAPSGLTITSTNPARYLSHFGASFRLPPNQGSPITKVHYRIIDATGKEVVSEKVISGVNPTTIPDIVGPSKPGDYQLRVWLEDEVGFLSPGAGAPIPHDTTPPAAPQALIPVGPTAWGPAQGYRLHWENVVDSGSPIVAAHYDVVDEAGNVVEPAGTVNGEDVRALAELETPKEFKGFSVRVWLEDEEGNVGAPARAPLPRDTTPPAAPQGLSITAPGVSKREEGFDVRWRNVVDSGSPIVAAGYQVLNEAGAVVVPTQTITGANVEALNDLEAPRASGKFQLRLWLRDAEGNVGVPSTAPLAYECVRSDASGGTDLSSGLGEKGLAEETVSQGTGSTLRGRLTGPAGAIGDASICIFSRVLTHEDREFLGVAMTGADGRFRFAAPAGPSRELVAANRSGSREVLSRTTTKTVVKPTFGVYRKVIYNKTSAQFTGSIPGPDNNNVLVVLQVRRGNGWLAFRRYRTRADGKFTVVYKFNKTNVATKYRMRAQVRFQSGYSYEQGNSDPLTLIVLPQGAARR